jgi:hypothetical protein
VGVFDEVLPTLHKTGTYTTADNCLIKLFEKQLEIKDQQLAVKDKLIIKLQGKVAVMTHSTETKHTFQLYKHQIKPNKYLFIRTQSRYLQRVINPKRYDIVLNEANLPNSTNILNRLKKKLVELHISFEASKNKLTVDANVLKMVQGILQEPKMVQVILQEPKMVQGILQEPKMVQVILQEQKMVQVILQEPKMVQVILQEPKMDQGILQEPKMVQVILQELVFGKNK